jgi:hypothetical protein
MGDVVFRSVLSTFALVLSTLLVAPAAASAAETPPATAQQALEQLLPSSVFRPGMSLEELEEVIAARFSDWQREDRTRALNNRKDIELSPEARSSYLHKVVIAGADKVAGRSFQYDFALTSPLSGARVYSIVHTVEAAKSELIARNDWDRALRARWGDEHGWLRTDTRLRATYFFDARWLPVENRGEKCIAIYPALVRLDEKTVDQVAATSQLLQTTGCSFSRDSFLTLRDGVAARSTFYTIDFRLQVDDVSKRVSFGLR